MSTEPVATALAFPLFVALTEELVSPANGFVAVDEALEAEAEEDGTVVPVLVEGPVAFAALDNPFTITAGAELPLALDAAEVAEEATIPEFRAEPTVGEGDPVLVAEMAADGEVAKPEGVATTAGTEEDETVEDRDPAEVEGAQAPVAVTVTVRVTLPSAPAGSVLEGEADEIGAEIELELVMDTPSTGELEIAEELASPVTEADAEVEVVETLAALEGTGRGIVPN